MPSIADSDAVYDRRRQLAQHQAALTLLQSALSDPQLHEYHWLDLACGKGQIILHIQENLPAEARAKIVYSGFDIDNEYLRYAERTAEACGFKRVQIDVGRLQDFASALQEDDRFDFITLTNTLHEIRPFILPPVLFDCVRRLSPTGSLFVYDMERLPVPELGAITWTRLEMAQVISALCHEIGALDYVPAVGRWRHTSCFGWNVQLQRSHFAVDYGALENFRSSACATMKATISRLLTAKLGACKKTLDGLTRFGPETGDEDSDATRQLYDYWSLTRELEEWS